MDAPQPRPHSTSDGRSRRRWAVPGWMLVAVLLVVAGTLTVAAGDEDVDYSPGLLSEAHAFMDDPDSCENCHNDDLEVEGDRCLICHDAIAERIEQKKGLHRDFTVDDCAMCHAEHGGRDADMLPLDRSDFDHAAETGFALVGAHAAAAKADCSNCHVGRSFLTLNPECASCHEDVHRGTLGDDCTRCHTPEEPFRNASRAFHQSALLPLEGRHLDVDCAECHWNGVIEGTPNRCYDCHWIRRQDDPFRTQLGVECEDCHRPISWTAVSWDHAVATGYEIGAVHRTVDCEGCHAGRRFDGPVVPDCQSCHLQDYQSTRDPDHVAAGFPTECSLCHRPSDPSWDYGTFEHPYPLVGTHRTVSCAGCHADGIYQGTPTECVDCHIDDYRSTVDPDHETGGFPTTCELCHTPTSWNNATFDHSTFERVGVHATLPCAACHPSGVYEGTPRECVGCHLADYQASQSPDHAAAGFPTDCETCHRPTDPSWQEATYPHSVYPLVASHALQPCSACHSGGVYQGLPSECVDCHLADYNATQDPDHAAAGFPTACEACHEPTAWGDADFAHTSYPLVGVHSTLDCQACHSSGVYQGLPSDCVDCHRADYDGSVNPDHAAAGFPTACDACHSNADPSWQEATYPHSVFPLVATHALQPCSACHSSGVYAGLPSECVDCHLEDYNATQDPNHSESGFPTTCEACHEPTSWNDADFAHTTYPLVGVHATLDCQACHSSGVYAGLPSACVDCHQADYDGSVNPDHAAAGFPTTCDACHSNADASWQEATYPHTVFPLVATHALQPCTACHSSGVYAGLPSACVDCHLADYNGTTDPAHASAGFPTTCEACHEPTTWQDATFDHTGFPLVGAHATQPCTACHSSGIYEGLPSDCVDCHQADYDASVDPDHSAAGFPTTCDACHSAAHLTWDEAVYGHTAWPLLGLHADQTCVTCHSSGIYAGLPSDCVDCHLDDYNATTDPDHAAVGYPTYCDICHRPSDLSWNQGTFDHFYFPITSGPHGNRDCAVCHISMPNMAVFSCLSGGCHPQAKTEDIHSGEPGFVYDSPACYACHPDGQPPGIVSSHRRAWTRASH